MATNRKTQETQPRLRSETSKPKANVTASSAETAENFFFQLGDTSFTASAADMTMDVLHESNADFVLASSSGPGPQVTTWSVTVKDWTELHEYNNKSCIHGSLQLFCTTRKPSHITFQREGA